MQLHKLQYFRYIPLHRNMDHVMIFLMRMEYGVQHCWVVFFCNIGFPSSCCPIVTMSKTPFHNRQHPPDNQPKWYSITMKVSDFFFTHTLYHLPSSLPLSPGLHPSNSTMITATIAHLFSLLALWHNQLSHSWIIIPTLILHFHPFCPMHCCIHWIIVAPSFNICLWVAQ